MSIKELADLGRRMREAQRAYFREKEAGKLEESKRLEREFDAAVKDVLDPPPPSLFDATEGNS